jgi:hypothetical protein
MFLVYIQGSWTLVYPIWFRIGLQTRPEVPYKTTQKRRKWDWRFFFNQELDNVDIDNGITLESTKSSTNADSTI